MVTASPHQHLILPIAPLAAVAAGLLTAGGVALLPVGVLESLIVDSGIAAVLSAAEPPLGLTARAVLALLCGGGVALVAWFALFLLLGTRSVVLQRGGGGDSAPVLRRADAHPDAPARRPVFANRDLGTPFLDVHARPLHIVADTSPVPEARPLPQDLDQPLSAYDVTALPAPPPPRRQTFAPGEWLETFPLTSAVRPPAEAATGAAVPPASTATGADPSVTIHALLDRLERSVPRRPPAPTREPAAEAGHGPEPEPEPEPRPEPERETLQDTLSRLRQLATRAT